MNFDQAWILWGLPLVILPVIIHLLNRLRYRPKNWAAMEFLLRATRHSTRQAKLRQFLVLACRVMLVFLLVLALSKPKIGGWLGFAFSGPPETIVILLDRSASMEKMIDGKQLSRRQAAINLLSDALAQNDNRSRVILIDSALCRPEEVPNPKLLPSLPSVQATNTATHVPKMMETALLYLLEKSTGRTEIWIASDMQKSNWEADNDKWDPLMAQYRSLPNIRVRLLALGGNGKNNSSIHMSEAIRFRNLGQETLGLEFSLFREESSSTEVPVKIQLDGLPETQVNMQLDANETLIRHSIALGDRTEPGWGRITIPNDRNMSDNICWIAFAGARTATTAVFAHNPQAAQLLRVAAAPSPDTLNQKASILEPSALNQTDLNLFSMILWQGELPPENEQAALVKYVKSGGIVVFFPGEGNPGSMPGLLTWAETEEASETPFTISHWDTEHGPLADTVSGYALPLDVLQASRRRRPIIDGNTYAEFVRNECPFLTGKTLGEGLVYACSTSPMKGWSNLQDGTILVPMLQRLLNKGTQRMFGAKFAACGAFTPGEGEQWEAVHTKDPRDIRWEAGVYRCEGRLLALNTPLEEMVGTALEIDKAEGLFTGIPFTAFEEQKADKKNALPSEIWRLVLYVLLGVLIVEGLLTLPRKHEEAAHV